MKGVRLCYPVGNPSVTDTMQKALPAFLGMTEQDIKDRIVWVPVSAWTQHVSAVTDGAADVTAGALGLQGQESEEGAPVRRDLVEVGEALEVDHLFAQSGHRGHRQARCWPAACGHRQRLQA
jgi:hypothetical protein